MEDEVIWAEAIQARNRAAHVYREAFAQALGEELAPLHVAFAQLAKKLPPV